MTTLMLRCAIVDRRSVFTMEIDSLHAVGILQNRISATKKLEYPGFYLRLYMAQPVHSSHGAWLQTSDADYEALTRGDERTKAAYFDESRLMNDTKRLYQYFASQPDEDVRSIHVLVRFPTVEMVAEFWSRVGYCGDPKNVECSQVRAPEEATETEKEEDQEDEAPMPFYNWIVAPLRESLASLASGMISPHNILRAGASEEASKSKAMSSSKVKAV